ncbi:MAG: alpha/beta fold hydrolase [Sphingomonadaceae bacterium]|nr:alpha/beta fold hydrolase [Sphingomonadaceae bacterium]
MTHIITAMSRERWMFVPLHVDSEAHAQHSKIAPPEVWRTRVEDMKLAISYAWHRLGSETQIVAAGHSYGALVAQALGGATVFGQEVREPRVSTIVAISPPGPIPNFVSAEDWAKIAVPMLVTTGTADVLPMIAPTWQAHLASFTATRVPRSAAWVGREVDHYFGQMIQRLARHAPNQKSQFDAAMYIVDRYIGAIAETLKNDLAWFSGNGPIRSFPMQSESFDWKG